MAYRRQKARIPSAKKERFTDSDIKHIEALYLTDDWKLMQSSRLGKDVLVQDFEPLEQWGEGQLEYLQKLKYSLEDRKRDYALLYYKPYRALEIKHNHDGERHTAQRVLIEGAKPNPDLAPVFQPECYKWTGRYPQEEYHRSQKKVRLQLAANKVGKTYGAVADTIELSHGIHPYRKMNVPNKGRIIGTDLEKGIEEDIWGIYKEFMPGMELSSEPRKHYGGQVKKVNYKNHSSVEFMSYEQGSGDSKVFEGGEGDWVLFNEPPPEAIYAACMRWVMKRNGIIMISATPLTEAWMYDKLFLNQGPENHQPAVFQLCAYETPYLSDNAIRDLWDATPEDEREARIFGGFKHLTGLVYKEFGNVHRIKSFAIPKHWPRIMIQDFHQRTPCALIWIAVDEKNTLYVYDELKIDKTTPEIAEAIKLKEKAEYGKPVTTRWIDSIAATPDRAQVNKSALKDFRAAGENLKWQINFRSSIKSRDLGMRTLQEYLHPKNGVPGIYFFDDKVPHTVASMLHFQYDMKGNNIYAHFADALRYGVVTRPVYSSGAQDSEEDQQLSSGGVTGYRGR